MSLSSIPASFGLLSGLSARARSLIWIGFIAAASTAFSLVLACATPFAALAAVSALNLSRRDATVAVFTAWIANQAIGFGLLGYPHDALTYAWGVVIGIGALLSLGGAVAAADLLRGRAAVLRGIAGFAVAFIVWQGALHASAFVIGSGEAAFTFEIIAYVLQMNVLALAILAVLHQAAIALGVIARPLPVAAAA
ncbi:hypothetical protein L2U69_17145 [Zavarzinia compransoris]|uniref:hypothetical protein n=1 Tax=Zavarzinia marina TaxID=2911065 RepID=UPI001F1865BB|nr:hypothetical protein [Zavarzinia marina]MCF4167379.1 hypothetical protein [Zavarzinia marina]